MKKYATFGCLLITLLQCWGALSWGNSNNQDRVLLEKVTAITLKDGEMTNGRRSSPVPQLDCVGGTAGCFRNTPKVVQCRNVGFDGYDVQWECTADLDNSVRFGRIEVSCEGYDSPNDPYILRGSCGLRYELDLTQSGRQSSGGRGYESNYGHHGHGDYSGGSSSDGSFAGSLIKLVVIGAILYFVLGACFRGGRRGTNRSYSSSSGYGGSPYGGSSSGVGGSGFWTGAATGGALGYMMGSSSRRSYGGSGWGSGWSSGGGSRSSSSSSSRSSSGFGGTSRR